MGQSSGGDDRASIKHTQHTTPRHGLKTDHLLPPWSSSSVSWRLVLELNATSVTATTTITVQTHSTMPTAQTCPRQKNSSRTAPMMERITSVGKSTRTFVTT